MRKHTTASVRRALLAWFRREARDLPWRRTREPYRIWLSEVMLQQTRIDQGLPYYERFIAAFPTVRALAVATEEQVLKQWEGLGYYSRARNLHRAAQVVCQERNGAFPETAAQWQRLPGVGPYTAGAVASIAFGERTPVVDGNVKRVLSRLYNIDACIDQAATEHRLWALAEDLVPAGRPGDFNQALMELGARICVPRAPRCAACPLRMLCAAHAAGTQCERPVRRPRKPARREEIVVAAIRKNGRYLLGKRPAGGLLGGLWEFPGGKVEPGEAHEAALVREAREELGVRVRVKGLLATVRHAYTHLHVTLHVYQCEHAGGRVRAHAHDELKWIRRSQLSRYPLPKANHKFLDLLP